MRLQSIITILIILTLAGCLSFEEVRQATTDPNELAIIEYGQRASDIVETAAKVATPVFPPLAAALWAISFIAPTAVSGILGWRRRKLLGALKAIILGVEGADRSIKQALSKIADETLVMLEKGEREKIVELLSAGIVEELKRTIKEQAVSLGSESTLHKEVKKITKS